jgi:hypothetical protein
MLLAAFGGGDRGGLLVAAMMASGASVPLLAVKAGAKVRRRVLLTLVVFVLTRVRQLR